MQLSNDQHLPLVERSHHLRNIVSVFEWESPSANVLIKSSRQVAYKRLLSVPTVENCTEQRQYFSFAKTGRLSLFNPAAIYLRYRLYLLFIFGFLFLAGCIWRQSLPLPMLLLHNFTDRSAEKVEACR